MPVFVYDRQMPGGYCNIQRIVGWDLVAAGMYK